MGFLPFFNLLCFGTTDAAERRKQQSRNNNKLEHLINVNPLLDYFTYFSHLPKVRRGYVTDVR